MFALPNLRLRLAAVVLVMASIFSGAAAVTAAPAAEASDSTCVHYGQWVGLTYRHYQGHSSAGWSHRNYYRHKAIGGAWYGSQYSVSCPYN